MPIFRPLPPPWPPNWVGDKFAPLIGASGNTTPSDSDSAALSDTAVLAASLSTTDTATLGETATIAVATSATDSGTLTDTSAAISIPASASDAATLAAAATLSVATVTVDNAHVTESASVAAATVATDSATLAETAAGPDLAATILSTTALSYLKGATGGSTQGHLFFAKNTGRWWFVSYANVLFSGTATSGTTQTLVDSGKNFGSASTLLGCTCYIIGGTGAGNAFEVTNTSTTTLRIEDNGDPATPVTLSFTVDATSQYVVLESRKLNAYVSSSADLTTATWALATGGTTNPMVNGVGLDIAGGRWDGGYFGGTYPTDGRQWAISYADVGGHDVVYAIAQSGVHWFKQALRGRITGTTTIAWDAQAANTNPWDDTMGDQEALPYPLQALALGFDTNNSRWHCIWTKTQGMAGSAWTAADDGTRTVAPTWGGYVQTNTYDTATDNNSGTHFPYQAALAEVGSGTMLAAYCSGNVPSLPGSLTNAMQTGLHYALSSSATAWPTTSTGAAIPNLSSTANDPNDWCLLGRTTSDVHVVRRNSASVIEHVRYNGTSWSSAVNLPSSITHQAGSGLVLTTDGTDVWCIAISTGAAIQYTKWTASTGFWDAGWTAVTTNSNAKVFLTGARTVSSGQAAIAWTEGTGPYSVRTITVALASASAISGSDSAALSQTTTSAAALSTSDTASLIDVAAVVASQVASDSATLTDSAVASATNAASGSDSASLTDSASIAVATSTADSGALADSANLSASVTAPDSAAQTDGPYAIAVSVFQTSTLSESPAIALADSDTAALAETPATASATATADSGAVADTASTAAALSSSDNATLSDPTPTVTPSGGNTPSATDTGTLADATLSIAANTASSDSAALSESAQVAATISRTDSGTLTESAQASQSATATDATTLTDATATANAALSTPETATLSEANAIAAPTASSDSASLAQSAGIGLKPSDSATLSEQYRIGLLALEAIALAESVAQTVAAAITESGALTEQASVSSSSLSNPTASDSAKLTEQAHIFTPDFPHLLMADARTALAKGLSRTAVLNAVSRTDALAAPTRR